MNKNIICFWFASCTSYRPGKMKTLSTTLASIICLCLIHIQEIYADQILMSYKITHEPVVDGRETEDVWKNIETITTYDPIAQLDIIIKSAYTDTSIFFLISYLDKNESRLHRSWVWNKENKMYDAGPDREDSMVFKWKLDDSTKDLSIFSDETYESDVWFWKACRTDPQGFADDKIQRLYDHAVKDSFEVTSKTGRKMFIQRKGDKGSSSYKTRIFVDFEGEVVPRYTLRQPQSSRADVRARGVWKDGRWTIELARALVTGNDDDINFHTFDKGYEFGVSRYEIAGRQPEPASDQPLYGSGDISEILTLEFQ